MLLLENVQSVINDCYDSWLECSVRDLNLNCQIEFENSTLNVLLTAGFPSLALELSLRPIIQAALEKAFTSYNIKLVIDFLVRPHLTQLAGKSLRGVKNVIAIASGKGGVGKSSVAVNLAVALERAGARVGILDADIYGPSIPLMLGKFPKVSMKEDKYLPISLHGLQAMSIGYLTDKEDALIWRGPMLAKALLQMLDITLWQDLDYLFIDLPPGTGDIPLSLVQKIPLTGAIVVTTPQKIATIDAEKALNMFIKTNIDVLGVIENMSVHQCSACGHTDSLFGTGGGEYLSEKFSRPLLGQLPLDKNIGMQSDHGTPIASQNNATAALFMKAALKASLYLAKKPRNYSHNMPEIKLK